MVEHVTQPQVLEAWCALSKALAKGELSMKQQLSSTGALPESNQDRDLNHSDLGQALVEVMEVAMDALVHPSKLVSSIAPVLLEHVIHLRQVRRTSQVLQASPSRDYFCDGR